LLKAGALIIFVSSKFGDMAVLLFCRSKVIQRQGSGFWYLGIKFVMAFRVSGTTSLFDATQFPTSFPKIKGK